MRELAQGRLAEANALILSLDATISTEKALLTENGQKRVGSGLSACEVHKFST